MKLLKEADSNVLYERALNNIDVLFEESTAPYVLITDERVFAKGIVPDIASLKYDWSQLGTRSFEANGVSLASCHGFPKRVNGSLILSNNLLKNLKGMPEIVHGDIWLHGNRQLESLEGAPQLCESLTLSYCVKLKNFEHCPEAVDKIFANCEGLESLKGLPRRLKGIDFMSEHVVQFDCDILQAGNVLFDIQNTSLKGIEKAFKGAETISVNDTPIKSHVMGLLRIDGLKQIFCDENNKELADVFGIINKYLPSNGASSILNCQDELLEAGFDEYAKL